MQPAKYIVCRLHPMQGRITAFLTAACLLAGSLVFVPAAAGAIQFSTGMLDATIRSRYSGKPIIVVFVAEWCPVCRQMRSKGFSDPGVVASSRQFEWLVVNIDRQPTLAKAYDVDVLPMLHVIDPQGRVLAVISGFTDAATLQNQLQRIHEHISADQEEKLQTDPLRLESDSWVGVFGLPDNYRAQSICFANVGYGPLDLPSQSALQGLRLGFSPRSPSTLIQGERELRVHATWVNIWADEPELQFDYETLQTTATFGYGLTDTLQVEGGISIQSRFGGELDSLIQEFHDLFGIDQDGRDLVPRGRFAADIQPTGGQPGVSLTDSDRGVYASAAVLTLQHNVTCGTLTLPAFSYSLTGRYEIQSDDLEGGSPLDFGISVAAAKRFETLYLYGTFGFAVFGRDRFRGLELRNTQYSFLTALEWRAFSTASLLIQYLLTEGLTDTPGKLSEPSHEITLGAKWEVLRGTVLEFGLIENIVTFGNSPDFGLHLGLTSRF